MASSSGNVGLPSRKIVANVFAKQLGIAFVVQHVVDRAGRPCPSRGRIRRNAPQCPARRRRAWRRGERWLRTAWRSCSGSRANTGRPWCPGRARSSTAALHPRRSRWSLRPALRARACGSRTPSSGRRASTGSRRPVRWPRCQRAHWRCSWPRRSEDSSTTSSCSSVAVWMNSNDRRQLMALAWRGRPVRWQTSAAAWGACACRRRARCSRRSG